MLQQMIAYLEKKGWHRISYHNPRLIVYARKYKNERQLVQLPASEEYSNYNGIIEFGLHRLAECEGINYEDARKKVSGEILLSPGHIVELIKGKIVEEEVTGHIANSMKNARNNVLEELLAEIKEQNDRLMEKG